MTWSLLPSDAGLGDPTIGGWLTTVGYLGTSYLCWRVGRDLRRSLPPRSGLARYWSVLSGALLLLGINKQLDFQLWLTHWGRQVSVAEGWYRQRGVLQVSFLVALALMLCSLFLWLLWWVRGSFRQTLFASAGTAVLIAFVLLRATSFDVADVMRYLHDADRSWALEMVGLLLIALSIERAARGRGWRMFAATGGEALPNESPPAGSPAEPG
jgi:hypothetical protein